MTLIEFNDAILKKRGKQIASVPELTAEDKESFNDLILCNKDVKNTFDVCESDVRFYKAYPDIKKVFGSAKSEELFYAYKLNADFPGVNNKLVYLIKKANEQFGSEYPNQLINAIITYLKPYAKVRYIVGEEEYSIKDVIESVLGKSINLLTDSIRKVRVGTTMLYEVWIPEVNRVAVIPMDITNVIPTEKLEQLSYTPTIGITLDGVPIRTYGDRLGLTTTDFNLEKCI